MSINKNRIKIEERGIVIIGAGPAGLAAAVSAHEAGAKDVLVLERDIRLGGILNQCIHDGFGLHYFKEALSGPEYAQRFIDKVKSKDIEIRTECMVMNLDEDLTLEVSSAKGYNIIKADAVILAMGCRERTAGAISLPGSRPAGVYTAGAAQNFINMQNTMVGKHVVILGSGDIGLIMARRLVLEGADVRCVLEIMPYSSGLPRNIQQCLNDYNIPLFLNTSVTKIHGRERIEGITTAEVDSAMKPIHSTERFIPCDTLLLSVGLIPENELSRQAGVEFHPVTGGALVDEYLMTSVKGIFACGNVLHVHDLVDNVSLEAEKAGKYAAYYAEGNKQLSINEKISLIPEDGIRYCLPEKVSGENDFTVSLRVKDVQRNKQIIIEDDTGEILREKIVRLHPAEMIIIKVKAEDVKNSRKLKVKVV